MTVIQKAKLTPELLITAPRRSSGTPNASGTCILHNVSSYDLDAHRETTEVLIMDVDHGQSALISNDSNDLDHQWFGDTDQIIYQRKTSSGESELWLKELSGGLRAYCIGRIPTAIGELQTASLDPGSVGITFTAPVSAQGEIFNPETSPKPASKARIFSTHPVRIFDQWNAPYHSSLFFGLVKKHEDGKWQLQRYSNALKDSSVRYPLAPSAIWGEGGSYTMNRYGILLSTPIPGQNFAQTYTFGMWAIQLRTFQEDKVDVGAFKLPKYIHGNVTSPSISPDGKSVSILASEKSDEEANYSRQYVCLFSGWDRKDFKPEYILEDVEPAEDAAARAWDRDPGQIIWSSDSKHLYIATDDLGSRSLFKMAIKKTMFDQPFLLAEPERIGHGFGSVGSAVVLNRKDPSDGRLFVSTTSMTESSLYSIIDGSEGKPRILSSLSNHGAYLGLSENQIESITYPGVDDHPVQAWIVRPSFFSKSKKYPLLFLIHGGPTSAWNNDWSTRWNGAVFAEQGYIVITPNFTGSTGYGFDFMSAIGDEWGDRPYRDIEKCYDWAKENLPYADISRAVLAGASFGGYMANWVHGQPLGSKLKAIVSHDGLFDYKMGWADDFAYVMGGQSGRGWRDFSPADHIKNWNTPMLIIHSEKDFRCDMSHGVAAYAVCQNKGTPSRFIVFPDENHLVLGRENSLLWHRNVLGWLNKYAGIKGGVVLDEPNCDL